MPVSAINCVIFLPARVILICTKFFTNSFINYSFESASVKRIWKPESAQVYCEQSLVLLIQDRDWSNDCSLYCYCDLGRSYPKPFAVETKNHFSNVKPIKENLNNENPKAWKLEGNLVFFQWMKSCVVISVLISV